MTVKEYVMADNSQPCLFCRIISGKQRASVIYEDELVVAFLDLYPMNPGHTLVVPKRHSTDIRFLDAESAAAMMHAAIKITARLMDCEEVACSGVNLLISNGTVAGQEIFHTHLHLIPRNNGDSITIAKEPRPRRAHRIILDQIANTLRKYY